MALLDEQVLIEKASEGDADAFEILVERYEKGVYNLAYRLIPDRDDAMDITQEVFLKAFQALPKFRGDSRFSTWLHRVCVNACLDFLRRKQRTQTYSLDEPINLKESSVVREVRDDSGSVEDVIETKSLTETVLMALNSVDEAHRTVIVLSDIRGYSYQEIADMLGISIGTVKSRLHRGRMTIRKLLPAEQIASPVVKSDERRDRR
ncbi:MAG TPA: sigma-70 family RNA polymerase sigma factor [Firmicutes bacterium]|nr:sigma-70 family RNA polymerase sigma factor [Candidatus Fermentithermobacillaceae bacterium]